MQLTIVVPVDQRAALLAGRVLGPTCEVEIDRDTMPADVWKRIVEKLQFQVGGRCPALDCWQFTEATQTELVALVEAEMAMEREAADAAAERESAERVRYVAALEEFERDGINREMRDDYGYRWEWWSVHAPSARWQPMSVLPPDWEPRGAARRVEVERICAEHNAPHLAEIERIRLLYTAEQQAKDEAYKVEQEAANARADAARLASGYWERETSAYNEKRHGAPWCARVSFPSGPKPVYEFGDSTAKWGKAGLLRLPCRPGDIIAWGQKDLRNPGCGEHRIAVMEPDGSMREIDKTEAFRLASAGIGGGK